MINMINERLKTALNSNESEVEGAKEGLVRSTNGQNQINSDTEILTTEEEKEGFLIIKSILRQKLPTERISNRDAKTYFAVLLDDNNRKPLCCLWFNSKNKQRSENEEVQEIKQQVGENIQDLQRQLDQVNYQIQQHLASNASQPQQILIDKTAGMELQEGAKMQFTAISVALGGALIGGLLINQSPGTGIAVASLAGVISLIINISAWSHIKRAREALENSRLALMLP